MIAREAGPVDYGKLVSTDRMGSKAWALPLIGQVQEMGRHDCRCGERNQARTENGGRQCALEGWQVLQG